MKELWLGKKNVLIAFSVVMLSACSSPPEGVIPIGDGTYEIIKQKSKGLTDLDLWVSEITNEATKFCSQQEKNLKIFTTGKTNPPYGFGHYPRSEIHFKCVAKNENNEINKSAKKAKSVTGTAFAVYNPRTLITAYHVIEGADSVSVTCHSGGSGKAEVIKVDPSNDLALLKINFSTSGFLSVGEVELKVGQKVFTLGYPVPEILGANVKYSEGVVSSLSGLMGAASLLQITTPIQPGNSGGPLINEQGELVGIITSTAAVEAFMRNTGTLPQSVNWAVKSGYMKPLLSGIDSIPQKDLVDVIEQTQDSLCMVTSKSD